MERPRRESFRLAIVRAEHLVADSFDPYHIWLGIPPADQPADHYRLLGISRFESNLDVIANAADQRVRHIRSMQTGKRQAESQRLLNEIAVASGTLLDPDQRNGYDAKLRSRLPSAQPTPRVVPAASGGLSRQAPTGQNSSPAKLLIVGGAIVAAIVVVVVVALLLNGFGNGGPTVGKTNPQGENASPESNGGPVTTSPSNGQKVVPPSPPPVVAQTPPPTPSPSTISPVPPVVVPMPPLVTPPPPAKSPPPASTANLEHQKNWEYGYGRLNAAGNKVVEFHPLAFSAELRPDGTKTVRWGVAPHYPSAGPLDILHLRKDGGHPANDPSIAVIRRWRHPAKCVIKASGELEVPERGGDGVHVRLVTGNGERILETKDRGQRVTMDVNEFVLEENEPLDLCVDSNINHSFDTFNMRLHLAVRFPDGKKEEWDSITDYRDPLPAGPMPATVDVAKPARFPIPNEASLTAARGKLKETFGDAVAKSKKPEEKLKLVAEFRAVAESEKDPAIRYVLLDTARRMALGCAGRASRTARCR